MSGLVQKQLSHFTGKTRIFGIHVLAELDGWLNYKWRSSITLNREKLEKQWEKRSCSATEEKWVFDLKNSVALTKFTCSF